MNQNTVIRRPDNIIEICVVGDQTVASVQAMGDQAAALAIAVRADGFPVLILDNLFAMKNVPPEARERVVQLAKQIEYHRLAMVGTGGLLRLGANLMLHATGKGRKVKFFTDIDSADHWLKRS